MWGAHSIQENAGQRAGYPAPIPGAAAAARPQGGCAADRCYSQARQRPQAASRANTCTAYTTVFVSMGCSWAPRQRHKIQTPRAETHTARATAACSPHSRRACDTPHTAKAPKQSRGHRDVRKANKQTNTQTNKQANKQTNEQTNKQTGTQTIQCHCHAHRDRNESQSRNASYTHSRRRADMTAAAALNTPCSLREFTSPSEPANSGFKSIASSLPRRKREHMGLEHSKSTSD